MENSHQNLKVDMGWISKNSPWQPVKILQVLSGSRDIPTPPLAAAWSSAHGWGVHGTCSNQSTAFRPLWRCPNSFISVQPPAACRRLSHLCSLCWGGSFWKDSHQPFIMMRYWPRVVVSSCLNATLWEKKYILYTMLCKTATYKWYVHVIG